MNSFIKRLKKSSDFEIDAKLGELIKRIDSLQISEARLREDIRQIVSEGLKSILNEGNKKDWRQIAWAKKNPILMKFTTTIRCDLSGLIMDMAHTLE